MSKQEGTQSVQEILADILQRRGLKGFRKQMGFSPYYPNGPTGNKGCRPRTGAKQAARYRRQQGREE